MLGKPLGECNAAAWNLRAILRDMAFHAAAESKGALLQQAVTTSAGMRLGS